MTGKAWEYDWSSAAAHTGGEDSTGMLHLDDWRRIATAESWRAYLDEQQDDTMVDLIREKTKMGRPLGDDGFISEVGMKVGRNFRPLPNGRPRNDG